MRGCCNMVANQEIAFGPELEGAPPKEVDYIGHGTLTL